MSKFTEYAAVQTLSDSNVFLIDGANGTKKINAEDVAKSLAALLPSDEYFAMLDEVLPPEMHGKIYRGKYLGASLTAAQKAAIADGTFKDLWLGDYWTTSGTDPNNGSVVSRNWMIADFDYWLNTGGAGHITNQHHIVIIPDSILYKLPMNSTSVTTGGYYNSSMRGGETGINSSNLASALTFLQAFGENLLTHSEYLSNDTTDGKASAASWYDSVIDIPTESMICGSNARSISADIGVFNYEQLALMKVSPKFANIKNAYWLRNIASATSYSSISNSGLLHAYGAGTSTIGVRPVAAIYGGPSGS